MRYAKKPDDPINELVKTELHRITKRHRRWGTPRLVKTIRKGLWVNHKRIERIYREEGLALPRRRPRKKRLGTKETRAIEATGLERVWSMDFMFDRTVYDLKLKILTIIDEFSRESLEIRVEKRLTSVDVIETLDELFMEYDKPAFIRTDNGPEFIAKKLRAWLEEQGVRLVHIDPGSPWQNGYIESFNGKFREECLNEELFYSRGEAQVVADWYREVYNTERPHSSLGYMTPSEYASRN